MKAYITLVALILAGCTGDTEHPHLDGEFIPDVEPTIEWLINANHPIIQGEGGVARYREGAYSEDPLLHRWNNGNLVVKITKDWEQSWSRSWKKIDAHTYQTVIPANGLNTEVTNIFTITGEDTYYVEIRVNGCTTREYYTRK
jgi:hypothetical protein